MVCTQAFAENKVDRLFRGHREPAHCNIILEPNSSDLIIGVTVGGLEGWEDGLYSGILQK